MTETGQTTPTGAIARPAVPATAWHSYSTRTLLVCAALAAAFAVLFASYTFIESAILPLAPIVIVFTSGLWFALPLLGMLYVRRVGSAVITAGIGGLLAGFFSSYGWQLLVFAVAYAVIVEIPFAITRWRRFGAVISGVVAGLVWLISLGFYWSAFAGSARSPIVNIVLGFALLVAFLAWAGLVWLLARALRRILPSAR